jgi:hypothetical protein
LIARVKRLYEQGLTHSLKKVPGAKKEKKNKKRKNDEAIDAVEGSADTTTKEAPFRINYVDQKTKSKLAVSQVVAGSATPVGGIKNAATASLAAKVLGDEVERNKRRKLGMNENIKSLFSTPTDAKDSDYMTRGYIIPAGAKRT